MIDERPERVAVDRDRHPDHGLARSRGFAVSIFLGAWLIVVGRITTSGAFAARRVERLRSPARPASSTSRTGPVVLEPAAQKFADATANPPYLFDLGPVEGRTVVDEVQSGEIEKADVEIQDTTIPGGPCGEVSIRILRPRGITGALPVILYSHGGGWVFGNAQNHDRLIRELAAWFPVVVSSLAVVSS